MANQNLLIIYYSFLSALILPLSKSSVNESYPLNSRFGFACKAKQKSALF
jgi:hypothetical protein